jgi:hypothetical protein
VLSESLATNFIFGLTFFYCCYQLTTDYIAVYTQNDETEQKLNRIKMGERERERERRGS